MGDVIDELTRTRRQRNECAAKVDTARAWRAEAAARAEAARQAD